MAARWLLLAILTASYGAGAFGMLGISPLSPSLVEGFGLSRLRVALIVPSIYVGGLFFSLPGGRLADRLGGTEELPGGPDGGRRRSPGGRLVARLLGVPLLPVRGRHRLERRQSGARPGHHRPLPCPRAWHRDGHQADGPHAGRLRRGPRPAGGRRGAGLACRHRELRDRGGVAGGVHLALTGAVGALVFAADAVWSVRTPLAAGVLAFASGIGAYGWVGVFFIVSAEVGGRRSAGLLSGVAFAAIVVGLLVGPTVFGLLLVRWDSYAVPWAVFAGLATLVTLATVVAGPGIDREREPLKRRASMTTS